MSPMINPVLNSDDADRQLERLTTDGERIAEALVALEAHPGYVFLTGAMLTGPSAELWQATKTDIALLYQRFDFYRAVLDKARQVRARRNRPGINELTELTELLLGESVELSTEEIPLGRRNLIGPSSITHRMSLQELISSMDTSFQRASDVVVAADEVWSAALHTLDPLDKRLDNARELCASLGLGEARHPLFTELDEIGTALAALHARAFAEPFSLYDGKPGSGHPNLSDADRLATRLGAVQRELDSIAVVRNELDQRVGAARSAIDTLAARVGQAREAYAVALEKITAPAIAEVFDETPMLRRQLDDVRVLVERHDWPQVSTALAAVTSATNGAAARVTDVQDTANALLARRAELRGRLDAYRVKAAQLRLTEDAEITACYQAAYDLLWTVPCDLRAATRALNRYQQAISAKGPTP